MLKITKNILLYSLIGSTVLFTGCGESTNTIAKKDKIIILHSVGVTGCLFLENAGNAKLEEQDTVKNTDYSSKNNSVNCTTYGKTRTEIDSYNNIDANSPECAELTFDQIQEAFPDEDLSYYENNDKSCVLSFDLK